MFSTSGNNCSNSQIYGFFRGDKSFLRVPEEIKFKASETNKKPIKEIKSGMRVQIFIQSHMGKLGTVDNISGSSIFVRVASSEGPIEVKIPNLFIIE